VIEAQSVTHAQPVALIGSGRRDDPAERRAGAPRWERTAQPPQTRSSSRATRAWRSITFA